MIKTITKIGNAHGLIFDSVLLELARLKAGDKVNVEVHENGTITVTPLKRERSRSEASRVLKGVMKDYAKTMKKLARNPI